MRIMLAVLTLAVIALAIALVLAAVRWRRRVNARREVQLNTYKRILRRIDVALDKVVAGDLLEAQVVENVRSMILDWYASSEWSTKRRLAVGNKVRRRIALELAVRRGWILLDSASADIKKFHREATEALRDNEEGEVPA